MEPLFLIKSTEETLKEEFGTNSDDEPYDHFLGYTTVSEESVFYVVDQAGLDEISNDVAESCNEYYLHTIKLVATVDKDDLSRIIQALTDYTKLNEPLHVGEYVKVLGNAVGTAWEFGCIEHIEGQMAYILYGVKNLSSPFGLRGQEMPVPISQLRRA